MRSKGKNLGWVEIAIGVAITVLGAAITWAGWVSLTLYSMNAQLAVLTATLLPPPPRAAETAPPPEFPPHVEPPIFAAPVPLSPFFPEPPKEPRR